MRIAFLLIYKHLNLIFLTSFIILSLTIFIYYGLGLQVSSFITKGFCFSYSSYLEVIEDTSVFTLIFRNQKISNFILTYCSAALVPPSYSILVIFSYSNMQIYIIHFNNCVVSHKMLYYNLCNNSPMLLLF